MGWLCWGEMWHILGSSERNSSMATPRALCHGGPPGLGLDEGKAEPTTQWCNSKNPQSLHLSAAAPSLPRGTPRTLIADQVLRGGVIKELGVDKQQTQFTMLHVTVMNLHSLTAGVVDVRNTSGSPRAGKAVSVPKSFSLGALHVGCPQHVHRLRKEESRSLYSYYFISLFHYFILPSLLSNFTSRFYPE